MRYRIRSALITITAAMLLGSGPALAASTACKADLTADGVVNFADLAVLKSVFFQSCNDPAPTCGDGVAQGPKEQCDDGNVLSGDGCSATCTLEPARHFPATGQTTCWNSSGTIIFCRGTGQDGAIQFGAALAYVDNGDGTVTDTNTGLMWEKLSDDGTIHDGDNFYTLDNAVAVKIAALNGGSGFAGHTDWRVPNLNELESIRNLQNYDPAVSAAFNTGCTPGCTVTSCSCTPPFIHLSSSSNAGSPNSVWFVDFSGGFGDANFKMYAGRVRAVRGGL